MINVILVDDDKLVCQALKTILEASGQVLVTHMGNSGEEAISLYNAHRPDLLLMDIRMPGISGIQAGTRILERWPDARILYLTTFDDDEYIITALKTGAKGYLLKQNFESIVPSIIAVINGQNVFGNEIVSRLSSLSSPFKIKSEKYGLTPRENDIIVHVANGLNNKEIADILFLSEGTVRNYISTILEKLNLRDRTQLAIFYYKN